MTTARAGGPDLKPPPDQAFGFAVHRVMWEDGITQTRLAELTGMDQSYLSKKLHGKSKWKLDEMIRVGDALGRDLRDLLGDMWGKDGDPIAAPVSLLPVHDTPSGLNNLCYSDGRVIKGPWKKLPVTQSEHAA